MSVVPDVARHVAPDGRVPAGGDHRRWPAVDRARSRPRRQVRVAPRPAARRPGETARRCCAASRTATTSGVPPWPSTAVGARRRGGRAHTGRRARAGRPRPAARARRRCSISATPGRACACWPAGSPRSRGSPCCTATSTWPGGRWTGSRCRSGGWARRSTVATAAGCLRSAIRGGGLHRHRLHAARRRARRSKGRSSWPASAQRARPRCGSRRRCGPTPRSCSRSPGPVSSSPTVGRVVTVHPGPLRPIDLTVPGDPSQAAFWLVAGVHRPRQRPHRRRRVRRPGPDGLPRRAAADGRRSGGDHRDATTADVRVRGSPTWWRPRSAARRCPA